MYFDVLRVVVGYKLFFSAFRVFVAAERCPLIPTMNTFSSFYRLFKKHLALIRHRICQHYSAKYFLSSHRRTNAKIIDFKSY